MRRRAAFVCHRLSVDTIGRMYNPWSVDGTWLLVVMYQTLVDNREFVIHHVPSTAPLILTVLSMASIQSATEMKMMPLKRGRGSFSFFLSFFLSFFTRCHVPPSCTSAGACLTGWPNARPQWWDSCSIARHQLAWRCVLSVDAARPLSLSLSLSCERGVYSR